MKLIVSQLEAWSTYVSREFSYIISDLMSTYGWRHIEIDRLWGGNGSIQEQLLDEFGELPETTIFCEGYELLQDHANEIYRLPGRKFLFADDLHWWDDNMRKRKSVSFALCDGILSTYGYAWHRFYPEFCQTKKVVWVPHSASPDFMLPFNPVAENSILLSGAISRHYPLRQKMKALQGDYAIAYHEHPGYFTGYDYYENQKIGRGYANTINRYRAAFTDNLTFRYTVAKYFEIPATGALLVAEDAVSGPLRELGFVANQHYVPVSSENLEETIQYVLDEKNHYELDQIRKNGQELVWNRHKTTDRARQIDEECG